MLHPFWQIPVYIHEVIIPKKGVTNMGPNDLRFLAHQERYKDLVREAAQQRLAHASRDYQQQRRKMYQIITSWIGFYLERRGCILEPSASMCCEA